LEFLPWHLPFTSSVKAEPCAETTQRHSTRGRNG
jgi:hypothetical protein